MILLVGVAGAGKSLQGKMIARDLGCAWISSGELFREAFDKSGDGRLLNGKLINDEETIKTVEAELVKHRSSEEFVLDGFPRTIKQAEWLISEVEAGRYSLTLIINLEASFDVVKERLIGRGRADDTEEVIEKRFKEFQFKTLPIINFYRDFNLPMININANENPEEIHNIIINRLESIQKNVHKSKDNS